MQLGPARQRIKHASGIRQLLGHIALRLRIVAVFEISVRIADRDSVQVLFHDLLPDLWRTGRNVGRSLCGG